MMNQLIANQGRNITELNIHGVYVRLVFSEEPNMSAPSIVRDILKESYLQLWAG